MFTHSYQMRTRSSKIHHIWVILDFSDKDLRISILMYAQHDELMPTLHMLFEPASILWHLLKTIVLKCDFCDYCLTNLVKNGSCTQYTHTVTGLTILAHTPQISISTQGGRVHAHAKLSEHWSTFLFKFVLHRSAIFLHSLAFFSQINYVIVAMANKLVTCKTQEYMTIDNYSSYTYIPKLLICYQ